MVARRVSYRKPRLYGLDRTTKTTPLSPPVFLAPSDTKPTAGFVIWGAYQ